MDDTLSSGERKDALEASERELVDSIDSATLTRLLGEVRNGKSVLPTAYNRMHNRHNRS